MLNRIYFPLTGLFFISSKIYILRFDPLCGEFNDKLFKESYQFVNEVKSKELVELKKQLRTEEDHERREEVLDVNQELMIILFPLPPGEVPDSKNGEPAQSRSSEPSKTNSGRGREFRKEREIEVRGETILHVQSQEEGG